MRILGLTGSIGMGKSTASQMLRRLRFPVLSSDDVVHALLGPDGKAVTDVAKLHGASYDKKTNSIDRAKLGAAVFDDPALLKKLEGILHPLVQAEQNAFLKRCRAMRKKIAVLDIPLLYETGAERRVDKVMVVSAPAFIQRQRVMARKGMNAQKLKAILSRQIPDAKKRHRADSVIPTGIGKAVTFARLKAFIRIIKAG
ncbi:MAG: dephospho-CoA kinase [Alphaproteobacteria bacterium]|nr:dephospho-CoA kinase [Alphaproteobacteria bacterium]